MVVRERRELVRRWVESEELEAGTRSPLSGVAASWCRAASGRGGTGGMVMAAEYARRTGTPFFGICYGFQWAVVEYARNVVRDRRAPTPPRWTPRREHRVIYKLQDLLGVEDMGGTMRLGSYPCELEPGSRAAAIYGATEIRERHRHRYEFNQEYEGVLEDKGL